MNIANKQNNKNTIVQDSCFLAEALVVSPHPRWRRGESLLTLTYVGQIACQFLVASGFWLIQATLSKAVENSCHRYLYTGEDSEGRSSNQPSIETPDSEIQLYHSNAEAQILDSEITPIAEEFEELFQKRLYEDFHRRGEAIANEDSNQQKTLREKAKKSQLSPEDLYTCVDIMCETPEIIQLGIDGSKAKKQKDYLKAIPLLQETALYQYWPAMRDLGEIYEEKKDFYKSYSWYVLAFQAYWLKKFKSSKKIKAKLINICQNNKLKSKDRLNHLESFDSKSGFFPFYPESSQERMKEHLIKLLVYYHTSLHEPYLTEGRRKSKSYWFNSILMESFILDANLRGLIGNDHQERGLYRLASVSYKKSGLPKALYNLGTLYDQGKLEDLPNYGHAAYYYEKSNLPEGLYNLGELYEKGCLGGDEKYEKAAYYYAKSNLEKGYYELANLYCNGKLCKKSQRDKAAYYYAQSNTPDALYCLGVLYGEETLGYKPNYVKAKEYYKKSATNKAFFNLGCLYARGKLTEQPNYQKAIKYYEKSEGPKGFDSIACLYQLGKIGEEPNYQKAAEYYEKSGSPQAFCQLGNFWVEGNLGLREPDYQKAAEYYEKSDEPGALLTLGQLYEYGKLTSKPDYKKAVECYKKSARPHALFRLGNLYLNRKLGACNYQEVARFFRESKTPEALCILGHLYAQGFLNKTRKPNYVKAAKLYEQSQVPDALLNLAQFHEHGLLGEKPNYSEALKYFEASNHPYKDWMTINMCHDQDISRELSQKGLNLEEIVSQKKENLIKSLQDLDNSSGEKSFIHGCLSLEEQNWEDAFIHFSDALSQGEERARSFLEKCEREFKEHEEGLEEILLSVDKEGFIISKQVSLDDREKNIAHKDRGKKKNKKLENKEEKKKEHTKRYVKLLSNGTMIPKNDKIKNAFNFYNYDFLDEKSEQDFNKYKKDDQKVRDLLSDIQNKPWATEGTGRPEVLRHTIEIKGKSYTGCLSRHINQKDRLVYKITGERTILILSWQGHYK